MPVKKAFGAHRSDEYNGSVVNGPQRTLVNFYFMHKGVMDEPM